MTVLPCVKTFKQATQPLHTPIEEPLTQVCINNLHISNFRNKASFFRHFVGLAKSTKQRPAMSLTFNVHSANLAHANPAYEAILQNADILRCDGIGAMIASRMLGTPLHTRLTNADYFPEMLEYLAKQGLRVYLIGGKPGVVEKAYSKLETLVNQHSMIGMHHGYFHDDETMEQALIDDLNAKRPDVVVVGMGMPLQEFWIARNRDRIDTGIFFAVGALIDYYGGAQYRCPPLFRKLGLEWLTRLIRYPKRMFNRYVVGNPAFLIRVACLVLNNKLGKIALKFQLDGGHAQH